MLIPILMITFSYFSTFRYSESNIKLLTKNNGTEIALEKIKALIQRLFGKAKNINTVLYET